MTIINRLVAQTAATVPGAIFLPTWAVFSTPNNDYRLWASVNHQWSILRHPDGIHFSEAGQNVLGTYAAQKISQLFHVLLHVKYPAYITG